jgi:hypothetical protein
MNWNDQMRYARERSIRTGRKIYVRGFQKSISQIGTWMYGNYDTPSPKIVDQQFTINPRRSVRYR